VFQFLVARLSPYIADALRDPVRDAVNNSSVLSIMFDGATDCAVSEVEIIYCRVFHDGQTHDYFIGLADLEHAHAQGVFDAINNVMSTYISPDWINKLIGAGSDGASVNIGRNNSVATRLREGRPYVLLVHCIAHRLELGVLTAIKDNAMLTMVQDMLKKVHKHYHYSPKALRELKAVAEAMEEKFVKPTRLQGTRWLPHISKALTGLLSGYQVILTHFAHVSQAGPGQATAPEVKGRAKFIHDKLTDFRVLRFIFFMQDLLAIVSTLSLRFQADGATCVDYLDALEASNLQLVQLRQNPGENLQSFYDSIVQNGEQFEYQTTRLKYYNADATYNDFQTVIDRVMDKLNNRFENATDAAKPMIQAGRVFDTKDWPHHDRDELALYGNNQITQIADHFAPVLERMGCERGDLQNEWTAVKAHISNRVRALNIRRPDNCPSINILFQNPDLGDRFKNLLMLVQIILTLPLSSSACERGFSAVKRIKTDWRATLATSTMNNLLTISIHGPSLQDYDAELAIQRWWTNGQRQRRPQFAAAPPGPGAAQNQPDLEDEDRLLNYLLDHRQ